MTHAKVSSLTRAGWFVACPSCGWQLLLPAESGCVAAGDRAYQEHLTSGRSNLPEGSGQDRPEVNA